MLSSEEDHINYRIIQAALKTLDPSLPEDTIHEISLTNLSLARLSHTKLYSKLNKILSNLRYSDSEDSETTVDLDSTFIVEIDNINALPISNTWMTVAPFDPKQSFQQWYKTFDLHLQFDKLDEERKLIALKLRGGDAIQRHIEELPQSQQTYTSIIKSLTDTFTGAISVETASTRLISYKFNYSEFRKSLYSYVELIDKANPSTRQENFRSLVEERLMNNLRGGLAKYLRNQRRHYTTLEEMLEDLILENNLQRDHHQKKREKYQHSDNSYTSAKIF